MAAGRRRRTRRPTSSGRTTAPRPSTSCGPPSTSTQQTTCCPSAVRRAVALGTHAAVSEKWCSGTWQTFHALLSTLHGAGRDTRSLDDQTGDKALRELPSPGKSGSVFFISHDERFFIKTMRRGGSSPRHLFAVFASFMVHCAQAWGPPEARVCCCRRDGAAAEAAASVFGAHCGVPRHAAHQVPGPAPHQAPERRQGAPWQWFLHLACTRLHVRLQPLHLQPRNIYRAAENPVTHGVRPCAVKVHVHQPCASCHAPNTESVL